MILYTFMEEEKVLGALGFRIRENIEDIARYGESSVIVVDVEAKRKGMGRILMKYAEDLAIQNHCKGTWLVTGHKRINEAHKFYKELKYEDTGIRFVKNF